MSAARTRLGVVTALSACGAASASIPLRLTGAWSVVLWLLGIVGFLGAFAFPEGFRLRRPSRDAILGLALALLPVAVRVLSTQDCRVHGDELITAYYSATEDLSPKRFFEGVPRAGDWVCQFPSPWFLIQRGWFTLFGDGLADVRRSQVPWVYLASVCFFFAARRIAGRTAAVVALVVYSFLAISVYIETTGLMFLSGTAIFMAFFLAALRLLEDGSAWNAAVAGVAAGFCYLFYTSAYIALPVFGAFWCVHFRRTRRADVARWILVPAAGALLVVGPFLVHALTVRNYFTERAAQVSFVQTESAELDAMAPAARVVAILAENLGHAVRSFWQDGLGGSGGYWFGAKSLLDPVTFACFAAGLLVAVGMARRNARLGLALAALAIAFVSGVVMTVAPVAYHRLSVVYPIIALVVALPLTLLERIDAVPRRLRAGLLAIAVAAVASVNITYFSVIAMAEFAPVELRLGDWVNTRYPDRVVRVVAFPGHAYEKLAYFAPTRRKGETVSDYHDETLQRFDPGERYLYLVTLAREVRGRFTRLDPSGHYVLFPSEDWAVFVNDGPRGAAAP